ncbi:MAG: hypothetical protein WCK03_01665 [Candidatus Taylorbacteria bacterium]
MVEGESDEVFLKHLNILFGRDSGSRLTVKSPHGNGDAVLKTAIESFEAFDRRVALYDNDRPPQEKHLKAAHRKKIQILTCSPCIEGLLLEILGEKPSSSSAECKRRLEQLIGQSLTSLQTYERHFPLTLLTSCAAHIGTLRALLDLFKTPL